MAEKKETKGFAGVTEESIDEQIQNANKYSKDIVAMADDLRDEKEKKRRAEELNSIRDRATYYNLKCVLVSRLINKQKKATDTARKKSLELLDEVVAGKLTRTQYEAEIDKSIEEANKTVDAALKEYDTSLKELRGKFPEGNWYEWDNPFRRIKNVSSEMRR
jgi:polyribonucleotide nucleotidyltransferase